MCMRKTAARLNFHSTSRDFAVPACYILVLILVVCEDNIIDDKMM